MTRQQRTVLIVNALSQERENHRRYLLEDSELAYTVIEETSGFAALALCKKQHVDGILLEFQLPDLDGLEFLTQLKALFNQACPPVIMVSENENAKVAVKAIKSGAKDYLVKGQNTPEELRSSLRNAIENAQLCRQLQASEERFRISVENMLDCFGIYSAIRDGSGQIVDFCIDYLNSGALQSNRMTTEDIGKRLCELLPERHSSGLFAEYCQVVETGQPLVKESLIYTNIFGIERLTRAYDVRVTKMGDGFVALWRDITEKKQAEEALRQASERFELAAAGVNCIIYDWDLENNIVQRTCGLEEITGYTPESAGTSLQWWRERIHPEDLQSITYEKLNAINTTSQRYCHQYRVRHKNGHYVWVQDYTLVIKDTNGQPRRVVGSTTDITERKLIEEALRKSEAEAQAARRQAEVANQTKDELLAIVSHELRSPLNSILGWAKLLQTRKFDYASTIRALQTIERNAQAQSQLIEDLLDVSRMKSGNLRLNLVPVNLVNVIEAAIDTVSPLAQAKQIEIESRFDSQTSQVSGDFNRLQQIVVNLLTNAIKFTSNGGQVEVELFLISCDSCSPHFLPSTPTSALIKIIDTGKGISPDFLPHLFERFQQADSTTRRSKDGLGLGLPIVRHLVELHGGTITAASSGIGKGATFAVKLPLITSVAS